MAAAAMGLAVFALAGWALHIPILTTLAPERPSLAPMTAVLLILGAVGSLAMPERTRLAVGASVVLVASALSVVVAHALALPARSGLRPEWWSSALTGALVALLGCAAWLLARSQWVYGQIAALVVFLFAGLVGLGHVFPDADLYRFMPGTGVAIPTVLGLMALSMSLLLACPRQGPVGALTSRSMVGRYGRVLLGAGAATVLLFAALVLVARRLVDFDLETAVVFVAWGAVVVLGATLWALAIAVDRANLARARAESERDEMRQLVAAAVTHDLRTPLQAASVSATLLQRMVTDPRSVVAVQRLQRSHRRLDRLVRSLLDTLSLDAGRPLRLQASWVELQDLVADVQAENEAALGEQLGWEGSASGWWDRDALYRVVENLVLNAAKYGDRSSPIWCRVRTLGEARVELTVENQGRPIDAADRESIFQPFVRGGDTQRVHLSGWGIGLAFARSVARSHGGDIRLQRSDAQATVFALQLPVDARPFMEQGGTTTP